MSSLEKEECMENLKILGVLDKLATTTGKASGKPNEEFSLDKPCFTALPVVLHSLFERLDAEECEKRFRDCWPILSGSKDRTNFKKSCIAWLKDIQKDYPSLEISHFSTIYDSPNGPKFVKFLLRFSMYILRSISQKRQGIDATNNNIFDGAAADQIEDRFPNAFTDNPTSQNAIDIAGLLELETKFIETHRVEVEEKLKKSKRESIQTKDKLQQLLTAMNDGVKELVRHLKFSEEEILNNAPSSPDYIQCVKAILECATSELQKYKAVWEQLEPMFVQCQRFDQAFKHSFSERPSLKGFQMPEDSNAPLKVKDVFLPDGRLDMTRLITALRSTINDLLKVAEEGDPNQISKLLESHQRNCTVLGFAVQQLKDLKISLKESISEMELSTTHLESKIDETKQSRSMVEESSTWLRMPRPFKLLNRAPAPKLDLEILTQKCKYDWNQICQFDDGRSSSINSTAATMNNTAATVRSEQSTSGQNQISIRGMIRASEEKAKSNSAMIGGTSSGIRAESSGSKASEAIKTIDGADDHEYGDAFSPIGDESFVMADTVISKPTPGKKFRLSMTPLSSFKPLRDSLENQFANGDGSKSFDIGSSPLPSTSAHGQDTAAMKPKNLLDQVFSDDEEDDN